MIYYIYVAFFILLILQIVSLFSNYWYVNGNNNWGLYNRCSGNTCMSISSYKENKAILDTMKVFISLSIVISCVVLLMIYFKYGEKHINKLLGLSSVLMFISLLLSVKIRSVSYYGDKQTGTPGSALYVCLLAVVINSSLVYIFSGKK